MQLKRLHQRKRSYGEKIKPKIEKRDKTTGKGNDVIYRKTIEGKKINETKSWLFEIENVNNPLTTLTKKKGEKIQMTNIRNGRGIVRRNTVAVQRLL